MARADAPAPVARIDEPALVRALVAHDPRRLAAAGRIATTRAEVVAARVRPNPSLAYEREVPFLDGEGTPTSYLRLALPFDVSGRRGLAIDAAETTVRAATGDARQRTLELVVDGLRAFDDAAHARLRAELLAAARLALVRAVEIARQRAGAGDASGYQLQRFELELADHDDELASARLELTRARLRLAALVGRTGELDAASTLAVPTAVPALDALLARARGRGDLEATRLRADAAGQRERAAGRGWVPTPTLTVGAMTVDAGARTGTGYVAGLAVELPVFDRGHAARARARAERQLATAEGQWLARDVELAVRTAHAALTARIAQAGALASTQLPRLDVVLRAAEAAFREGNASVVELLDAHRAARTVRLRELALRHQIARDRHDLELAVGERL